MARSTAIAATELLTTPWRVVMVAESPGRLLENNFLILNLNEPCAIADTSWIKPGKVIREVSLTTAGGKACVDFAVKRGLQYVEYDAGWYGHEYDPNADARAVNLDPKRSKGPLDLHEVIRYADERGIGIIVYVNHLALEKQLDELLPLYKKWGIKGIKFGFVNVGSQQWTRWLHDAIRKCAEHQFMVDVHDEYRLTGLFPDVSESDDGRGHLRRRDQADERSDARLRLHPHARGPGGQHGVLERSPRDAELDLRLSTGQAGRPVQSLAIPVLVRPARPRSRIRRSWSSTTICRPPGTTRGCSTAGSASTRWSPAARASSGSSAA